MERDETYFEEHYNWVDFNSHAHVERDITILVSNEPSEHFNSHAHVERDSFFDNDFL